MPVVTEVPAATGPKSAFTRLSYPPWTASKLEGSCWTYSRAPKGMQTHPEGQQSLTMA